MEPNRTAWNQQQKVLQAALAWPQDHPEAVELFLRQHASLHAGALTGGTVYSFEDEIWNGLNEVAARAVAPSMEHSIAWVFWHITRIEDITMNLLVAGQPQVLISGGWLERMNARDCDTGNEWSLEKIISFSAAVNINALRAYRLAVARQTREIVHSIPLAALKQKVEPERLLRVTSEGAVGATGQWLVDFWGRHTHAGLLLMPATRHIFVHLNEAQAIRKKLKA